MDGVFWHNDVGYVVDTQRMPSKFPGDLEFGPFALDDLLRAASGFPNLKNAPVASWLVARLFHLTGERLGFRTVSRVYKRGGCLYLNLIAFTRELTPFAFLDISGDSDRCECWIRCAPPHDPEVLIASFVDLLTSEPTALTKCRLTVIDTDPPDRSRHRRFGKPYLLGWDGVEFLGG